MKHMILGFLALLVIGCQSASKVSQCQSNDWFESGRQAGAAGLSSNSEALRTTCGGTFDGAAEGLYTSGYNHGLSDYCTAENGFAIGKSGAELRKVCPRPMDQAHIAGYQRGLRVRKAEEATQVIERKISSVHQKLKTTSPKSEKRGRLLAELDTLKKERDGHKRHLGQE